VDEVLGDRHPDASSLRQLPLCESVLMETLRVWPPAPITTREATDDHIIGEDTDRPIHIRKGTTVVVPALYAMPHAPCTMHHIHSLLPTRCPYPRGLYRQHAEP
jgi:hypothetical protein